MSYRRTEKKWTEPVICGKWMPNEAWDFDKSEEWQQLLCLINHMQKSSSPVTCETLDAELAASVEFLTKGGYPPRTKALHMDMKLRLKQLLGELVTECYLTFHSNDIGEH